MCTAITFATNDHYFGRNLDLDFSYNETVTITPRNYVFPMRKVPDLNSHYTIIGMATVVGDYPLYYDAVNEKGLGMAGLNFPAMPTTSRTRKARTTSLPLNLSHTSWELARARLKPRKP